MLPPPSLTALCGYIYLMGSSAVGVGANTVISTTLKWFADKQGTASGTLLMGFGMGSMVLGSFVTMFIAKIGWRSTFMLLAALFGAVLLASSFFIKVPPKEFSEELTARARKKNVILARDFTSK
ncbi:MAG: MFS transporter, partial [Synergistaceae bacterium]